MNTPERRAALAALIVLAGLVSAGCTSVSGGNEPPVAVFEIAEPVVDVNELVVFDGERSRDKEGNLILYQWNFGDGGLDAGAVVSHRYAASGVFTVTLTVTDEQNQQNAHAANITVNAPPQAVLEAGPGPYFAKEEVAFSGASSSDADGRIQDYYWDFGDGASATTPAAAHAFADTGSYTVRLQVADNHGARANATFSLFVDLHTYDVTFSQDTSQQQPVRNFTVANMTKTVTVEIFLLNITRVEFSLTWRDPLPVQGPPNDVIQLKITSPDGPSQTMIGTFDNITLEFNVNGIPSPVQVRAATPGDVPAVLGDAYIGSKGVGVWVVEITAVDLGGGFVQDEGFVPEPFFIWTLTTSITSYEAEPQQIG